MGTVVDSYTLHDCSGPSGSADDEFIPVKRARRTEVLLPSETHKGFGQCFILREPLSDLHLNKHSC